jgi:hypothetical protein
MRRGTIFAFKKLIRIIFCLNSFEPSEDFASSKVFASRIVLAFKVFRASSFSFCIALCNLPISSHPGGGLFKSARGSFFLRSRFRRHPGIFCVVGSNEKTMCPHLHVWNGTCFELFLQRSANMIYITFTLCFYRS